MAKKKIRNRGLGSTRVLPDKRTKVQVLEALDRAEDLYTGMKDANGVLSRANTDLHDRIQHLESIEDDLKEQLGRMKQQRDQLLDAIEDFEEADHESVLKAGQREVAYARLNDLHSEIGTERSNEMVQPIPRQRIKPLRLKYNQVDNEWTHRS